MNVPMNDRALITSVKSLEGLPFDALCRRVASFLDTGVAEAKALHARRAEAKRELGAAHQQAIDEVLAKAEAWLSELKALRTTPEAEAPRSLTTRLELARRRLRTLGVLERTA